MVKDFAFNAAILLLCVFAYYLYLFHLQARKGVEKGPSPLLTGLVFGLAGIGLLSNAIIVEGLVRMDLRSLAILMAAALGGMPAALTTAVIIGITRFAFGGIYYASVVGSVSSVITALGAAWILNKASLKPGAFYKALLYCGLVTTVVYIIVIQDAETFWKLLVAYWLTALPVGWLCCQLHMVLTRFHKLYKKLHYREETYRQLFHSAQDSVFLVDLEPGAADLGPGPGRFLDINEMACQVLGYTREELMARNPSDLYDPAYLHRLPGIIAEFRKQGRHTFEWGMIARGGRTIPVEVSGRIFKLHGESVCLCFVRDITLRKESERKLLEANRKLEKLSVSDGLTGIANRRGFDAFFRITWDQVKLHEDPMALLFLDIDCFKPYNDTYGHMVGDQCLKQVAAVLETTASLAGGFAARYGGEEFAVVLPAMGRERALEVAEEVRGSVEALAVPHASSLVSDRVTVSVGVAVHIPDATSEQHPERLLQEADLALYRAKNTGRNRVMAWEPEWDRLSGEEDRR
ncbi:diguanylate cyclase [Gorillibacterium sp. sgz5001074]|uniref:diguanylate cyclase n=1 Tax=Gorillibacterium sp. sgz5001074 TaxID=3446695 RepID=UPI003F678E5E